MKKKFSFYCMLMAFLIFCAIPVHGSEKSIPDGMNEVQWNKLNDKTIDFDELPDRIRYFNPDVQNASDIISNSIEDVQYIHDKTLRYIIDMQNEAEELKNSGATETTEGLQQYMILTATVTELKTSADTMKRTLEYMNRPNSAIKNDLNYAVKNYAYYASQVMTQYNNALSSRESLQKAEELCLTIYEVQTLKKQLGTATEADVISAKKDLLAAQASVLDIDNTINSLLDSLCLMTGYSVDDAPAVGKLPELDLDILSSIDLESDTEKAIGNNYSLISMRHEDSDKSTSDVEIKEKEIDKETQKLTVTMQSFYQTLLQSKEAYEAACTSYEKAVLDKQKADHSYQLGQLDRSSYLKAEMEYLQAENTKQNTYNSMYQAYDIYKWAVEGIIVE